MKYHIFHVYFKQFYGLHRYLKYTLMFKTVQYKKQLNAQTFKQGSLKRPQHYSSGRTMALGLTQLLIEMSTRNISWG